MIVEVFLDEAKLTLALAIRGYAVKHGMNQTDMAYLLETSQPRVSDLFKEKVSKFSLDQLIKWAYNLGIKIDIQSTNKGE